MLEDAWAEQLEEVLLEEIEEDVESGKDTQLIVYNDDFNTFDWVIESFVEICRHTVEQAEQLSLIVHFKGKATVKTGPLGVVRPMKEALIDRGISAVIEN
ncbi:MAG: ATP-dependent Clp protease adaptor ClpS [Saprospiraceae bacterium]|nr:ATP-dependent Clp protease adaptor ClpS [Saprospiraceae bacterium]